MMYIAFDGGELIADIHQPFILSDNIIVKARDLNPSEHQLINGDGRGVVITELSFGNYNGGIHTIATNASAGL